MVNLDSLLDLVPASLHERSGAVFYSGASAFSGQRPVYLLGLNPGGDPLAQAKETIGANIAAARLRGDAQWSEYHDECWANKTVPGTHGMQPRILHMCKRLGLNPHHLPASNVVFVRSRRESDLQAEKSQLLNLCWPVHQAAIDTLGIKVVVCLGKTCGQWVRERTGATIEVDHFVENNSRRWRSFLHRSPGKLMVTTLTHPSIAAWNSADADPLGLVEQALL